MPLREVIPIEGPRIVPGKPPAAPDRILWFRKVYHIISGLACVCLAFALRPPWLFVTAVACLAVWLTAEIWRRRDRRFHEQFLAAGAGILRHEERVRLTGNFWTCLAMVIVTGLTQNPLIVGGCLVGWSIGDPAAEIAGRHIRSQRIDRRKTIVGALACFIASFIAFAVFFRIVGRTDILTLALTGAFTTTVAETYSGQIDDNLTIPLLSALAIALAA